MAAGISLLFISAGMTKLGFYAIRNQLGAELKNALQTIAVAAAAVDLLLVRTPADHYHGSPCWDEVER